MSANKVGREEVIKVLKRLHCVWNAAKENKGFYENLF